MLIKQEDIGGFLSITVEVRSNGKVVATVNAKGQDNMTFNHTSIELGSVEIEAAEVKAAIKDAK